MGSEKMGGDKGKTALGEETRSLFKGGWKNLPGVEESEKGELFGLLSCIWNYTK